jgi:hypothetical protein
MTYSGLATKQDLALLASKIATKDDFQTLQQTLRQTLLNDIQNSRLEIKADIARLRTTIYVWSGILGAELLLVMLGIYLCTPLSPQPLVTAPTITTPPPK